MASYLTFLQLCNLRKPYTVLERVEPFEDLDEEEVSSTLVQIFTAKSIHKQNWQNGHAAIVRLAAGACAH